MVVVSLKYLGNFGRSLDLSLINCEIKLDLSRSEDCMMPQILNNSEVPANPAVDPSIEHFPEEFTTGAIF